MQVVTCFQCAHQTKIAPNAYRCHICGEDLQHLLLPETVVDFFQARAHELSERSELGSALAEAERGLTYVDSSELHLLAAILAKQLGRHDRMRQHVAAIPVDDTLRGEAEWLLRSHQDRERALQEAAYHDQIARPAARPLSPAPANSFLEELLGGQPPAAGANQRTYGQVVASVVIVVFAITMVAASWWWIGPGGLPVIDSGGDDEAPAQDSGNLSTQATTLPTTVSESSPTATIAAEAVQATPTALLLPMATLAPAIPANLVQVAAETPQMVDANPRHVVVVESTIFDIKQYLRGQGYAELAELPIDGRLQGDILVLQGIVHFDMQRRELLEVTRALPGVREVNALDLLLRPLPTYVVQEGDTLWSIVYNIYGDVERLDEFAAYNRSVLPAPDALGQGIVLQVLPIQ